MLCVTHAFSDASLAGWREPCALQRCIELNAFEQAFWSPYLDLNIPFGTDFLSATTHILLLVISLACVRVFLPCTVPALNLMQISIYQTAQAPVLVLSSQELIQCLIQRTALPLPLFLPPFESSQRWDWFYGTLAIGIIPNVGGLACEACDAGLYNFLSRTELKREEFILDHNIRI